MSTPDQPARLPTVQLPSSWRTLEFLSDLHLQDTHPARTAAFAHYLQHSEADAIFILGDLFEVWVGDDLAAASHVGSDTARAVMSLLSEAAAKRPVYMQVGNRDFLLGETFWRSTHVKPLADPCVLDFRSHRLVVSHGDTWCLADSSYQKFRQLVRSDEWQRVFLAKPLAERIEIAQHIRSESQQTKSPSGFLPYMDVDTDVVHSVAVTSGAQFVIHGHTHLPGTHHWVDGRARWVLSDWELDGQPTRGDFLRFTATTMSGGPAIDRIPVAPLVS